MGDKKEKAKENAKERAKEIVRYCLSTFDDVEEPGDGSAWEEEIKAKEDRIEKIFDERVPELQKNFKWKIFNDSIHKTVELNPVEIAIIQTPEFFRLKNIKQAGGGCHVYPGAVHTRFEHSIGVCHLAGEFINNLKEKIEKLRPGNTTKVPENIENIMKIEKEEEMCVRLAGLCHDLGHGPYSHLFESIKETCLGVKSLEKLKKKENAELRKEYKTQGKVPFLEHEELSVLILKWILVEHLDVLLTFVEFGLEKKHVKMIAKMIVPTGQHMEKDEKPFLYEIVANKKSGLDVDKWDYFTRDCHHLGLTHEFDYGRTLKLSCIVESEEDGQLHVGFMKKEIQNIYRMFRTRCTLHQKAYKHKVIQGIEMQIEDIIYEIKDKEIFGGSKNLMQILTKSVLSKVEKRDLSGYFYLTDSILDIIHNADLANEKIEKIMLRELYWRETEAIFTEEKKAREEEHLKEKNPSGNYRVKQVKISYASEEGENPLQYVYFYDKECLLPAGKFLEKKKVQELLTGLNMSEIHTGYVVRVFNKEPKIKRMKFE